MNTKNILRNIAFITLALGANLGTFAQNGMKAAPASEEKLPAGTTVVMETLNELSSGNMSVGMTVPLRVKYDVIVKGKVLIKGGAMASGQVTSLEQRGGMGKKGSFTMRPTVAQAVDGQMIVLTNGGASMAGEGKTGSSVALAAVVSPLFLLKKGKDATLHPGYEMPGTVANYSDVSLAGL